MDAYQHKMDGGFFLCGLNESTVGYTENYDMVLSDTSKLLPQEQVKNYVKDIVCRTDEDCRFTAHCTTLCDTKTWRCTENLVRPNLVVVCQIIEPYLVPGAPRYLRGDLLNLLDKCQAIHSEMANFDVNHSLVLNDLRSLLWRTISPHV